MTGTLGLFSLVDLFQLLASARRSGRLSVDHPKGTARVYFEKGQVVHAEFAGATGEQAVYDLFADERGTFEFRLGMPALQTTIKSGTENLVLESVRRLDESNRGAFAEQPVKAVSRDAVPVRSTVAERVMSTGPEAAELDLTPEERRLIQEADGVRTITRIAMQAGIDPDRAAVIAERLVRTGVLKLNNRRVRTARLVTRLTSLPLQPGEVGVDQKIIAAWEKALEATVDEVACRRGDGSMLLFSLQVVSGAGPFLEITRDTLVRANLAVNEALLVRPLRQTEDA